MVKQEIKETLQWFVVLTLNVVAILLWLTFTFLRFESLGKYDTITNFYIALLIAGVSHGLTMIIASLILICGPRKVDTADKEEINPLLARMSHAAKIDLVRSLLKTNSKDRCINEFCMVVEEAKKLLNDLKGVNDLVNDLGNDLNEPMEDKDDE